MNIGSWRLSRGALIALALALIVWTALAWFFAFAMSGSYVCSIMQPIAVAGQPTPEPMPVTPEEWAEYTAARCNRVPWVPIAVFGAGYVVIAAVAIRSARLSGTDDDPAG